MPFVFTLGFATEADKTRFVERILPRLRATPTDAAGEPQTEGPAVHHLSLSVTSQSAAKETCHHLLAFLAHVKNSRVTVEWTGADGQTQNGEVQAGTPRDAEVLAMRLGQAAKTHMDSERAESAS
jgi:hypothetical protein